LIALTLGRNVPWFINEIALVLTGGDALAAHLNRLITYKFGRTSSRKLTGIETNGP